ncbi:MAG: MFS transporter [Planctomycetes bacterium]|nr:MFS transporter [Planctomycetota bacterium]
MAVTQQYTPSRARYRVVGLCVLLAMVTYLDRACIATLAPQIMADLDLDKDQMSYVYSAFALAYAAFEIPTALWADRLGTRLVLTRIVGWWSAFTVATAVAWGQYSLMAIRFLFGMGEAGAWPSAARTFSQWIPRRERGTVQGVFFAGAHLSGGLTPSLVLLLLGHLHWRMIFVLFGVIGFAWAAAWQRWYRDDPALDPRVNEAERDLIYAGRDLASPHAIDGHFWRKLLRHRNVIALCVMYFPNSFVFYFCITWLPTFLHEKHGFSDTELGVFAGLPLLLSVLADLFGGVATDWAVRRFGARLGRAGVGFVAYAMAAVATALATVVSEPMVAASLISIGTAASMFTLGAAWGTCQDIAGSHTAALSATMNTSGQIGSILSPIVVIYLAERFADWNAPLILIASLFAVGAAAWCVIDPNRRVLD